MKVIQVRFKIFSSSVPLEKQRNLTHSDFHSAGLIALQEIAFREDFRWDPKALLQIFWVQATKILRLKTVNLLLYGFEYSQ